MQHKQRKKKKIFFFLEIFANTEFSIAQYSIRYKSVISTSSRLTSVNAEVMKGNETAMAASERPQTITCGSIIYATKFTHKLNKLRKRKLFERQRYQNNDHSVLRLFNASYARLTLTLTKAYSTDDFNFAELRKMQM